MNNCKTIKTQIEETALGDDYGQLLRAHLMQCDGCRQFEAEQRKLRELVGSVGTVQAPADFDYKLRARMANASGTRTSGLKWFLNPLFATAAAIVLFVGLVAGVNYVNRRPPLETSKTNTPPTIPVPVTASPNGESSVARTPTEERKDKDAQPSEERRVGFKRTGGHENVIAYKPKRQIVAADFSQTAAPTFGSTNSPGKVFPIDASLNSMKVSLDDGEGNARTISLPGISFGSQRVTSNQAAQKGVW